MRCASRSSRWSRPTRAAEAEALYPQSAPYLSTEAPRRSRAARRLDLLRPRPRRRCAARRRIRLPGASGEWAAQAHWIAGLAAWRINDCASAGGAFPRGRHAAAPKRELAAAGAYWAARADRPAAGRARSSRLLKAAARSPESFYGLVARETLGMDQGLPRRCRLGPAARVERAAQRPPRDRAGRDRRMCAGRADAPPPGADRHRAPTMSR